ncbi:hypothetical protein T484DRAFT_1789452 [Baffinella frigidus]|nr:hypothetical protein T484DRAFT_1789452 [Cryptophyta sp. CCMP2293]
MVLIRSGQRALWVLVALLLIGSLRGDVPDEEDYVEEGGDYESGGQGDPAYEQYAERLQQQLESLRKEHDEIFGRADTDKDGFMSVDEYFAIHAEAEQNEPQ